MKADNKDKNGLYICKFEDRIHKHKLPKGLSYVLQTTDITNVLPKDGLAISYSYQADNPKKPKPAAKWEPPHWDRYRHSNVDLLAYIKRTKRWGEPGTMLDYDRYLIVYSVPAKLRKAFRAVLISTVLPFLGTVEVKPKFNISVNYQYFNPSNYGPLDRGGIYIEQDRYSDRSTVLYRDKEFNLDKEIKECLS